MKKFTAIVLSSALTLTAIFSGCGSTSSTESTSSTTESTSSASTITIGYSSPDMNNTGQTYIADYAKLMAAELGATITVTDAQNDVVKQQDQVKALIQQGVSALVVVPADTSAMEPVTAAAQAAGIPIVYCNVNPLGDVDVLPDGVYYIGSQEIDAGIMQGEYMGEYLGGEGKAGILMGGLTYEASYQRTDGVKQVFAEKYPNIEVIAEETAEWQRDMAIDVVNNWLTAYGDELTVIFGNNDEMALGAVEALKAAGRTDIKVMGIDAISDACESILNGELVATVYQDFASQGGGAVEIAYNLANGTEPAESITWVPFLLVTEENAADYVG